MALDKLGKNIMTKMAPDERDTPEWVAPIALVITVLLIIGLGIGVIRGDTETLEVYTPGQGGGSSQVALVGGQPGNLTSDTVSSATTVPGTTAGGPGTTIATDEPTVVIETIDGATVSISRGAVAVGAMAAEAKFTGVWDDVPVEGVTPVSGLITWPDAEATFAQLETDLPNGYVLVIGVDPDGIGPEAERTTSVAIVRNDSGDWVYKS